MIYRRFPAFNRLISLPLLAVLFALGASHTHAQGTPDAKAKSVIEHWTRERRSQAIPRDLVIDNQGRGYLRKPDGSLAPYGHNIASAQITVKGQKPFGKPSASGGSGGDTTPPTIADMDPAQGSTIGSSYQFSADVTDDLSSIRSVTFVITYPDGVTTQSFSANFAGGDTWNITLQGFSNGSWSWHVVAKDGASKGGNTATSPKLQFMVDTGSGGGTGGSGTGSDVVTNAAWTGGDTVQDAAGRLYFEMPSNSKRKGLWNGYVCSGTVATDSTSGRSVIITASHCVYDDANKAFARNVLFIPNQAGTSSSGTDLNCGNDPMGCWVPSFGVVDVNWTTRTFPNNIAWDYAYYVVNDSGAHLGASASSSALDSAAGSLAPSFDPPFHDDGDPSASSADFTHALGYSYSEDPKFMYCAEDMTTEGAVNWWLASCGLSGGSSGGPWVQPMDESPGSGPIISVNSWGYTNSPGMAGPMLDSTSAECLFGEAKALGFPSEPVTDGDAGVAVDYCP